MVKKNPNKALRDFEKQHDILGVATLRQSCVTDADLAKDLLEEMRGLREPCYVQRVKAIGGSPVVLFSRHPLYPETIAEWRKLDRARNS